MSTVAMPGSSRLSSEVITVQLSTVEPELVEWLWPGRIPQRKLTLFCGDAGLGKSSLTLDIAARVSKGLMWPGSTESPEIGSVVLLSAEDGVADTIRPRIDAMGGDASKIWVIEAVRIGKAQRSFSLDQDIARLREVVKRYDARIVIIDPLTAYMGKADTWKDAEVRRILTPLAELAASERVAVIGVMHPSKAEQQKAVYRASGSIAFVAVPRVAYLVAEDPQEPERCLVATIKCNIAEKPSTVAYHFESAGAVARVVWDMTPVPLSAQHLVGGLALPSGDSPELERAKDFLRDVLTQAPMLTSEVLRKAKGPGISPRTLERAKKELGIESRRVDGLGGDGAWVWALAGGSLPEGSRNGY
jgi:archaellum biogenesis ATPase FlaH